MTIQVHYQAELSDEQVETLYSMAMQCGFGLYDIMMCRQSIQQEVIQKFLLAQVYNVVMLAESRKHYVGDSVADNVVG